MVNLGGGAFDPFDAETTGAPHPIHSVTMMTVLVERLALIDADLAGAARDVAQLHKESLSTAIYSYTGGPTDEVDTLMVDNEELSRRHRALTTAFHKAVGRNQSIVTFRWRF